MEKQDLSVNKIHSGTKEYWQAIVAIFMAVNDYFGLILLLRLCQGCLLAGWSGIVCFLAIILATALLLSALLMKSEH